MKKILKSCSLFAVASLTFLNVNASTIYYTNPNGVSMTEQEYNKIVNMLSEERVDWLTQEQFNHYISANIVDFGVLYQKDIYNRNGLVSSEIVTEKEYNDYNELSKSCEYNTRSGDTGYFETTYKRLNSVLSDFGNNDFDLSLTLTWKKVPACRSYDIFAFRTTHMSYSNVLGAQAYYVGSNPTNISYNSSSSGYKYASNGAGFSMNLKDDSNITKFVMALDADLAINEWNYSTAHVFTTYQHATSDLTQAQSKSYTFGPGDLGDVVYFSNTTIRNKYDGMSGIELRTYI